MSPLRLSSFVTGVPRRARLHDERDHAASASLDTHIEASKMSPSYTGEALPDGCVSPSSPSLAVSATGG